MLGRNANDGDDMPQIAVLFTHFAPYHIDRIEALAHRLQGRAHVLGVEAADSSREYGWEPARRFELARHVTLFPGRDYEDVSKLERLTAYARTMRGCDLVLSGIPYSHPDVVALAWRWKARGRRIIAMTDSKFDDKPRNLLREQVKARLLAAYDGAIVAGTRQRAYLEFLGFQDRPILPGYDTLSVERVRSLAASSPVAWQDRPFTYVGRLVGKKNLATLIEAYARYVGQAGASARRLVLVGDGEQREELRQLVKTRGIAALVDFAGHCDSADVARWLSQALALCLVSTEEQWGLVVNEAVALGIPALVSTPVGARDALVRSGETGHVVDPHSPADIARAMLALSSSETQWHEMAAASRARSWLADADRFADAVEWLIDPAAEQAAANIDRFWQMCERS